VSTCTSKRQRSQHFVILLYPAKTSYKHIHTIFITRETVIRHNACDTTESALPWPLRAATSATHTLSLLSAVYAFISVPNNNQFKSPGQYTALPHTEHRIQTIDRPSRAIAVHCPAIMLPNTYCWDSLCVLLLLLLFVKEGFHVCMLLLLCVRTMQAPSTPPLLTILVYALQQTHSILSVCRCGTFSLRCVYITLQRLLGKFVPAAAVAVCTVQAPCYDNTVPFLQEQACKVSATPPPPGGGLLLTLLLCLCRVCVFTGNFMRAVRVCSQSICLLGLERFSYGRGRSGPIIMSCCILDYTLCSPCTK